MIEIVRNFYDDQTSSVPITFDDDNNFEQFSEELSPRTHDKNEKCENFAQF